MDGSIELIIYFRLIRIPGAIPTVIPVENQALRVLFVPKSFYAFAGRSVHLLNVDLNLEDLEN